MTSPASTVNNTIFGTQPVVTIQDQDGNTVAVSHGVQDKIAELKKKLGDLTIVTIFDQAPFVEKSLENLTTEGLLGLTFAIIVHFAKKRLEKAAIKMVETDKAAQFTGLEG